MYGSSYLGYITCRWRRGGLIMSNKKSKLVKGSYITEAMYDLMNPSYNFCITDQKSKNKVDSLNYQPSSKSFKDIDRVPNIGDIVIESVKGTIIKIKQIEISNGRFLVSGNNRRSSDWYALDKIYPIKLNHHILIDDLGFEVYGYPVYKGGCKLRFTLKGFTNLKLIIDSYDGNLDPMVWTQEGKSSIHYLHELQDILRFSSRDRVITESKYSKEVKVLTKSEYPIYHLPENNDRS